MIFLHDTVIDKYEADFVEITARALEAYVIDQHCSTSSRNSAQDEEEDDEKEETERGLTLAASLVSDICNNEAGSIIPWHQYEDAQYYNTATKTTTNSDNSNNMVEEEKSYTIQKLKIPSESQTLEALKGYLVSLVENLIDERDPAAAASDDDDDTATGDCSEEQATLKEAMNRLATQHINTLQIAIQTLDKQLQALL
eukprot:jgi/Bigna1/137722/aug1.40_g12430